MDGSDRRMHETAIREGEGLSQEPRTAASGHEDTTPFLSEGEMRKVQMDDDGSCRAKGCGHEDGGLLCAF